MNLLLLLSALLSALTGATSAVREPTAAHAVAAAAAIRADVARVGRQVASRPGQQLPGLRRVAALVARTAVSIASAAPLYASRRRE